MDEYLKLYYEHAPKEQKFTPDGVCSFSLKTNVSPVF